MSYEYEPWSPEASYEYEPWSFAPEGGAVAVGEALEKVGTPLGSGVVVGAGLLVGEALASTVGDELGAAVAIVGDAVSVGEALEKVGEALEKVGEALEKVGTPLGSGVERAPLRNTARHAATATGCRRAILLVRVAQRRRGSAAKNVRVRCRRLGCPLRGLCRLFFNLLARAELVDVDV